MTVDSLLLRDVCEYDKYLIKKAKLDYLEIMFCDWIGKNKTNITTEDEESVQRKLDIETVKEGELTKREPMERYLERRKNPVACTQRAHNRQISISTRQRKYVTATFSPRKYVTATFP